MQPAPLLVYLAGAAHGRRACRRIAGRLVLLFCQTQGLVALISAYETFLADYKRGNVSTVYEEAVTHGSWRHIQPEDCWTELPGTLWTPIQRRPIESIGDERIAPRVLEIHDYRVQNSACNVRNAPEPSQRSTLGGSTDRAHMHGSCVAEGDDSDGSGAHTSSSFVDQNRIASRRTRTVTLIRYSRELAGAIGPCQLALT